MERLRILSAAGFCLAAGALLVSDVHAGGPLAAQINVTPLASYTGSSPLPRPEKTLVYDFAINTDDAQVDKMQSLRPRHLIARWTGRRYWMT